MTSSFHYAPSKGVPWSLATALCLLLFSITIAPFISGATIRSVKDYVSPSFQSTAETNDVVIADSAPESEGTENGLTPKKISQQHQLARLLIRSYHTPAFTVVLIVFFCCVVILAPITEEFLFRVVLQSSFEKQLEVYPTKEPTPRAFYGEVPFEPSLEESKDIKKINRQNERARRFRLAVAIAIPALIFASLHIASPDDANAPEDIKVVYNLALAHALSNILTLVVGLVVLIKFKGATFADLGFDVSFSELIQTPWSSLKKTMKSWGRGILLMCGVYPLVVVVNVVCQKYFPDVIVAPIPIFVFALIAGSVYYRSRRYATTIGMHMTLNFISFILLLILIYQSF